jgi:hypothetical protein
MGTFEGVGAGKNSLNAGILAWRGRGLMDDEFHQRARFGLVSDKVSGEWTA